MKSALLLAVPLLFWGVFTARARADAGDDSDMSWMYDPEGAPPAFIEAYEKKDNPQGTSRETEEAQDRKKLDDDQLLREYEEQLKERDAAKAAEGEQQDRKHLYSEMVESQADLAKLTNDAVPKSTTMDDLRTGSDDKASLTLRPDPALLPAPSPVTRASFQPLIKPFGFEPGVVSVTAGEPGFSSAPVSPKSETVTLPTDHLQNQDPGALDTPGMTAAEKDPTAKDFALDLSPQPSLEDAKSPRALELELPIASDTARLKKQEMASLQVPGQKPKTLPPAPINPRLLKAPDDQENMVPVPSPTRAHVDDPFDILNR